MNCPACEEGILNQVNDISNDLDGYIFIVKGRRCPSCGEEFIDEKEGQAMIQTAKRLNLWGQPFRLHRKLSQSARGTMLRISADFEKDLHLKGTEMVAISKLGSRRLLIEIESTP